MTCPFCEQVQDIVVFPAAFRSSSEETIIEKVVPEEEASCFYHDQNRATGVCESCGRFICKLCQTDLEGKTTCLVCLTNQKKSGNATLENRRVLYDSIALALSLVSLILFYLAFITFPIVLYYVIRYWKKGSTSVIPRSRFRYVLALIISILGLTISGGLFFAALIQS